MAAARRGRPRPDLGHIKDHSMSILLSILLDALASDIFDEITNVDLISATKR
jgi:hypothetical protein